MELKGKKVLVVGLGSSGLAAARLCLQKGARVKATDLNPHPAGADELERLGAELFLGGHRLEDFTGAELVVLSPGVDPRMPEVAAARRAGVEVIGELELGLRFLRAPAVMITGSNGKSTVTSLVGEMLAAAGIACFVGGNLGNPLCAYVAGEQAARWAVLEVSSFQLDTAPGLRPRVGVLLNITPDHLDRYADFDAYVRSKQSLLSRQGPGDTAILYAEDPRVMEPAPRLASQVWRFGAEGPLVPGGWLEGDELVLETDQGGVLRLELADCRLVGKVNRLNLLAAALAALACGADASAVQEVIRSFPGLPHRLQYAGSIEGVDYYDDSKGTNLGAVQAALESLDRELVLLLGGRDKGGDFASLREVFSPRVKVVICFGEAGPSIHRQIEGFAPSRLVDSLEEAFLLARELARPGQAVLLSPGCASFDAYSNYGARGEHFQQMVQEAARG